MRARLDFVTSAARFAAELAAPVQPATLILRFNSVVLMLTSAIETDQKIIRFLLSLSLSLSLATAASDRIRTAAIGAEHVRRHPTAARSGLRRQSHLHGRWG